MIRSRGEGIIAGCLAVLFLAPLSAGATAHDTTLPLAISAKVDKKTAEIGDRIRYWVRISAQRTINVETVQPGKNFGDFELEDFSLRKSEFFGRKKITLNYLVTTFEPGKRKLPSIEIKFRKGNQGDWQVAEVPEQVIEIKSLVQASQPGADIRDIKGPIGLPMGLPWKIIALTAAAVIASSVYKFFKERKIEAGLLPRPAHEIAYEQLESLKNKGFIRQGKIKEYYSELSSVVRQYLENRFRLRAPEMTTEEFLVFVRDYAALQSAHKQALKDFLSS